MARRLEEIFTDFGFTLLDVVIGMAHVVDSLPGIDVNVRSLENVKSGIGGAALGVDLMQARDAEGIQEAVENAFQRGVSAQSVVDALDNALVEAWGAGNPELAIALGEQGDALAQSLRQVANLDGLTEGGKQEALRSIADLLGIDITDASEVMDLVQNTIPALQDQIREGEIQFENDDAEQAYGDALAAVEDAQTQVADNAAIEYARMTHEQDLNLNAMQGRVDLFGNDMGILSDTAETEGQDVATAAATMREDTVGEMEQMQGDKFGIAEAMRLDLAQLGTAFGTVSILLQSGLPGGAFPLVNPPGGNTNNVNNNVTINANNTSETAQAITGSVIRNMPQ
jgi:hypothetical protein